MVFARNKRPPVNIQKVKKNLEIICYSNSDYTRCEEGRNFMSDNIFTLTGEAIS